MPQWREAGSLVLRDLSLSLGGFPRRRDYLTVPGCNQSVEELSEANRAWHFSKT